MISGRRIRRGGGRSVPPLGRVAAGEDARKGTDVLVDRTYQHANREILIESDPLPVRLRRSTARNQGSASYLPPRAMLMTYTRGIHHQQREVADGADPDRHR